MTPPTPNYQLWILGFNVFQFVCTAILGLYVWWKNRNAVTTTRFDEQDKRITGIETKAQLAQQTQEAMVKHLEELGEQVRRHSDCKYHQGFERRLDETTKELSKMNGNIEHVEGLVEGRLKGIGSALDMIQQHLMTGGK